MMGGEDWLLQPVLRRVLAPERLVDGSVDLAFVALLNEALDCEAENQLRASKAHGKKG